MDEKDMQPQEQQIETAAPSPGRRAANEIQKTTKAFEHEPESSDPNLKFELDPPLLKKKSDKDLGESGSLSGAEVKENELSTEKELSGETKNQSQPKIESSDSSVENSQNPIEEANTSVQAKKKSRQEEEEDLYRNEGETAGVEDDLTKNKTAAKEVDLSGAVGGSVQIKEGENLKIDQIVGRQDRQVLSNGQQVVALDIDKEKWLNTKPDKDGNLRMSLYSPLNNDPSDNFSRSVIKVPRHVVATMPVDERGHIKLLVAEQKPYQKSDLDVYMDSPQRREQLVAKNGALLSQDALQGKQEVLDKPAMGKSVSESSQSQDLFKEKLLERNLRHPAMGFDLPFKGKELVENMPKDKQDMVNAMNGQEVKEMLKAPENKQLFSEFLYRREKKLAEMIISGDVKAEAVSRETPGELKVVPVTAASLEVDKNGNEVLSFNVGSQRRSSLVEDLSSEGVSVSDKDMQRVKNEVLSDMGKELNSKLQTSGKVVDFGKAPYQHDAENEASYYVKMKTYNNEEKVLWGKELEKHMSDKNVQVGDELVIRNIGKQPVKVNVPIKDEQNKVVGFETKDALRNSFEVNKIGEKGKQQSENSKEKLMESQITPESKYKDYVDKMGVDEQGAVKKLPVDELAKEVASKAPELAKNESELKAPGEIKQDGSAKPLTASEKLTDAILKNDTERVEKMLQQDSKVVGKEHLKLMNQMKDAGEKLSPKIEAGVRSAMQPSHAKGISI